MTKPTGEYRFGPYELRALPRELFKHGTKLRLRPQPLQILFALVERGGDVLTREELRALLWPSETFVDFEHRVNASISELREVLSDPSNDPLYVETLPKVGYRMKIPIEVVNTGRAAGAMMEAASPAIPPIAANESPSPVLDQGRPVPPRPEPTWARRWLALTGTLVFVLLTGAYLISRKLAADTALPKIKSVAVLPLKNLSGDPTKDYLADGMTEDLIGRLAGIKDLRVISHTSVMRFSKPDLPVPEIAKTLNVDAIVEGSVMPEGNRIRVTAQLIRGSNDTLIWSETYDRDLRDALALQSELAQAIAEKVEATVTGAEHKRLIAARPVTPEVYESYLKGRFASDNSNTRAGVEQRIGYFEDAIKKDPTFAPAYVGLANANDELGTVFIGAPPQETRQNALIAAQKALDLDPNLVDAHILLAGLQMHQWQWADAETEYRRVLELSPNNAVAHGEMAFWFLTQGRTQEALAWMQRGRELDPLAVPGKNIGWILFLSRRYDDAIREYRSDLAVAPDDADIRWQLGFALIAINQPSDAVPVLEKALADSNRSPGVICVLIRAYAHSGRRDDALRLLAELKTRSKVGYVPAGAFVIAYLGLGDNEEAFRWLERAYREKSNILFFAKTHPIFDPIRNDPRFADLVRRIGLA
jgi:TolB-like protein/DNA-binding winged helix-turn-helix (wHTH) protein/Flp pilus assembly protein TadD